MSNIFTTGTSNTTATFNFPVFISGSDGQTWWWNWTGTGTATAGGITGIFPTPINIGNPTGKPLGERKISGTEIEYEDYEVKQIYKVKKEKLFKLFDWFIYEKMKLEGNIKEII